MDVITLAGNFHTSSTTKSGHNPTYLALHGERGDQNDTCAHTHTHTHTHTESHNEILPFYAVTLAHMGGRTNAFKVLVGRHHLQDLGVDGTIRVKWIFK